MISGEKKRCHDVEKIYTLNRCQHVNGKWNWQNVSSFVRFQVCWWFQVRRIFHCYLVFESAPNHFTLLWFGPAFRILSISIYIAHFALLHKHHSIDNVMFTMCIPEIKHIHRDPYAWQQFTDITMSTTIKFQYAFVCIFNQTSLPHIQTLRER